MTKEFVSFVRDLYRTTNFIPLHAPIFQGNERKYVNDTLDSSFVSSVGEYVNKSEELMQSFTNSTKAIAVVNGTAALTISLKAIGVNYGDEVITQALTFVATANAIVHVGAEPVFLDVDYDTMGLSPMALESFLTEYAEIRGESTYNKKTGKKIAACVPMHTFGFPVKIDELVAICSKWNIPVLEDTAESLGSYYKGKHTGTFGTLAAFSFNGNKIVTSGGGGMVITDDITLGKHIKHLTTTAKIPHPYEFVHDEIGYNFRMPNLNAALLCGQLEQLENFLLIKRNIAVEYENLFKNSAIKFRTEKENSRANYWLMCVELDSLNERDNFLKETNDNGVMTRPIWKLLYKLTMFKNCYRDSQKSAEYLESRIVNIPSSVFS